MATITRIERKSGARFKAIIKHRGLILKTKTFSPKPKRCCGSNVLRAIKR
ncbi:MAG: hypothetical protein HKN83_10385 [Gammaproteobacteria bacterium]|nr:hypothetical protein [Gammaproteobacteria bacterium]